jgi:predicted RecB family endonuclease
MYVTKASGEKEEFDAGKVRSTCVRAGASEILASEIASEVESRIYDGISTKEIHKMTHSLLKEDLQAAFRYDLKQAIFSLGPAGFSFEAFMAEVLRNYGYKAEVDVILEGKCVPQEVDIVAELDGNRFMIECKYHNTPGIQTDLHVAMYTYARFLDLREKFDQGWLVCNTKCTLTARQYAECVGLKLSSWRYPKESLESLIEKKKLYPVTILTSVSGLERDRLLGAKIMLVRDLLNYGQNELEKLTGLPESTVARILEEVKLVV